jgi:hypothetical protein
MPKDGRSNILSYIIICRAYAHAEIEEESRLWEDVNNKHVMLGLH